MLTQRCLGYSVAMLHTCCVCMHPHLSSCAATLPHSRLAGVTACTQGTCSHTSQPILFCRCDGGCASPCGRHERQCAVGAHGCGMGPGCWCRRCQAGLDLRPALQAWPPLCSLLHCSRCACPHSLRHAQLCVPGMSCYEAGLMPARLVLCLQRLQQAVHKMSLTLPCLDSMPGA